MCIFSGRNKDQKLVSRFLENPTFCRLLIAVPLKMYSKFGRNGEIGRKMANGQLLFLALESYAVVVAVANVSVAIITAQVEVS